MDNLDIPQCLIVTPEEHAKRRQWWRDNPPRRGASSATGAARRAPRDKARDWRLPRDMTPTAWAILKAEESEKERKKRERLQMLKEKVR